MSGHRSIRWCIVPMVVLYGCQDAPAPTAPAAGGPAVAAARPVPGIPDQRSTVAGLLSLEAGPVAIAHRGMGPNRGEDPTRPIENTVDAVRRGYEAGASVVEVDLTITADGEIV
ncbi:MAG: glycerophosphodiester phosphodiesterase family protein, partial [Phycisphaerales bacterium JB038]